MKHVRGRANTNALRVREEADGAGGIGGKKSPLPGVRGGGGDWVGGDRAAAGRGRESACCREPSIGE